MMHLLQAFEMHFLHSCAADVNWHCALCSPSLGDSRASCVDRFCKEIILSVAKLSKCRVYNCKTLWIVSISQWKSSTVWLWRF